MVRCSLLEVVILGCGYTGQRVAQRFAGRGATVTAPTRAELAGTIEIPRGALVLHSIPEVESGLTERLLARFSEAPQRLVYFSTTGVYGATRDVDEHTDAAPVSEREKHRLSAEAAVCAGPWSSLVLRPAAIYGPGRGIHVSMREGRFQLAGAGDNFVSRIHVDDLAAHAEAGLLSDVTGAWPVADDLPCTSREIADFCSRLLNLPMPPSVPIEALHETRRADRRVDGRAIRARLRITLQYPTYREGIPASL
jgi:nucleoside-diphosphate-sugar epimerase